MAPTEILAEQHLMTLTTLLEPLGVRIALLTNAVRGKAREDVLADVAAGTLGCAVGTHALVQEGVRFKRLGLCVVDEQHRFGVAQRATLRGKGERPDVLVMTATPIPRTLALTLYGDLEVSVIDQLPPGRKPVLTKARAESRRRRGGGASTSSSPRRSPPAGRCTWCAPSSRSRRPRTSARRRRWRPSSRRTCFPTARSASSTGA
jgi:ATP-dependent DNA helicase RecG